MVETIDNFISRGIENIFQFFDALPENYRVYLNLGIFIVLVTLYAIFIWKFHRFLGKRDLLELNLNQYNTSDHPVGNKIFAVLLFIIEYIIILPIVVFFWFVVMALILLILAQDQSISNILLISAVIVGSVRISSYYKEDLARELAKLFPLTILAVAVSTPGFLDFENTISKLSVIPSLFSQVIVYLFVIAILEFFLRLVFLAMPPIDENDEKNTDSD